MKTRTNILTILLAAAGALLLNSCTGDAPIVVVNADQARLAKSALAQNGNEPPSEDYTLPIPKKHEEFVRQPYYPQTYREWKDEELMSNARNRNCCILIERGLQRGKLLVDGKVAMDFPVCTGRRNYTTKLGTYHITDKNVHHISSIYDVSMPYFMRLTDRGLGLHVGDVFRHPVSHGCIRLQRSACEPLFRIAKIGTRVRVVE